MNNGLSGPKEDTKPASKADAKSNQEPSPPKKGHRKSRSDPGNTGKSSKEGNKLGKGMLSKTPTLKEPRKEDPTRNLGWKSPTPSNRSERITHDESYKPQGPAPGLLKPPVSAEERRARTRSLELPAGRQQVKKAETSHHQRMDIGERPQIPLHQRCNHQSKRRWERTRSMGVPTAVQQAKSSEVAEEPKCTPYTDLNQEEILQLAALSPLSECATRRRIKSTNTTVDVLHWDDLNQLADGIELEAGVGTVNAASFQLPVEMKAKLIFHAIHLNI
ncbi:hypothetical protein Moror_15759 [Moniliophthora roreri MCA 2997]|uniref:Uncharacterized protein n=1 Tax=Moniliophthora roreri (strain MCA 2997) TaxID=1381753 RepID=V2WJU0_MONRO|nr:hypothetical protein Moror_15759 [Moniliophthora roreri MCA 2997]